MKARFMLGRFVAVSGCAALAAATLCFAWVLWRSVPFALASYAAWAGIFLALLATAFLVRPPRWLRGRARLRATLLLVLGASMTAAALLWPSGVHRSASPQSRLDDYLPEFQFVEYHETRTRAPIERVTDAAKRVSLADMPAARVLVRLRALASGQLAPPPPDPTPLLDLFAKPGQGSLVLAPWDHHQIVLGIVGRPWRDDPPPQVTSPGEFLAFSDPGSVRVVFDIRVVDEGSGVVRLSTETRILGNDLEARRLFARYWRLIYPGSAIIRRVWLDAIVERAEVSLDSRPLHQ